MLTLAEELSAPETDSPLLDLTLRTTMRTMIRKPTAPRAISTICQASIPSLPASTSVPLLDDEPILDELLLDDPDPDLPKAEVLGMTGAWQGLKISHGSGKVMSQGQSYESEEQLRVPMLGLVIQMPQNPGKRKWNYFQVDVAVGLRAGVVKVRLLGSEFMLQTQMPDYMASAVISTVCKVATQKYLMRLLRRTSTYLTSSVPLEWVTVRQILRNEEIGPAPLPKQTQQSPPSPTVQVKVVVRTAGMMVSVLKPAGEGVI